MRRIVQTIFEFNKVQKRLLIYFLKKQVKKYKNRVQVISPTWFIIAYLDAYLLVHLSILLIHYFNLHIYWFAVHFTSLSIHRPVRIHRFSSIHLSRQTSIHAFSLFSRCCSTNGNAWMNIWFIAQPFWPGWRTKRKKTLSIAIKLACITLVDQVGLSVRGLLFRGGMHRSVHYKRKMIVVRDCQQSLGDLK